MKHDRQTLILLPAHCVSAGAGLGPPGSAAATEGSSNQTKASPGQATEDQDEEYPYAEEYYTEDQYDWPMGYGGYSYPYGWSAYENPHFLG